MASSNVCWGIEIGAAAIKAIKMEATGEGRIKVLDFAVIQHPKVLSTPGIDANDVVRVSLGALTSQYDLTKASIAVSVPGHSAFARFAKLPPVEPKKVPDIVKFEAMQQIPFPLDQVEWDYQTFVSPDSPDVEVGIFAITRERVTERLAMLEEVGITPNFVVLSPIAVYNAVAYDLEFGAQTPGTIIVDVGTTSTDLVIATPGRMWVRTFPIGGHQFTEALVNQFQLSYPKAEKLKREAEDTKHARQVFQAMRPVFTDLAQDIQRSIGYYQSLNKDADLTRLIGVGSTFRLPGLRKYLKQQLSMDVYRIEQFKRTNLEGEKAAAFDEAALNLATAYGLALQGLGLNAVGGNLMPVSVLRRSMWKDKVAWFGLAAGVAALAGGVMFVRPVKDHFDVTGRVIDPVIQASLSRANDLKQQADNAGVTAAGEPDYRAANMVALLEKQGIFDMISRDLAQVFEAGNAQAGTWAASLAKTGAAVAPVAPGAVGDTGATGAGVAGPAFNLVDFQTTYEPPTVADPTGLAPQPGGYGGPAADADPLKIAAYPRIKCELLMTTSQPEARRFVKSTVDEWLNANAKREAVPYTLVFSDPAFSVTDVGRTASATPAPAGRDDFAPAADSRGLGGRRQPTVDRGGSVGERIPPRRTTGILIGEGLPSVAEQKGTQAVLAAADDLNKVAPITPPEESVVQPTGTVRVTWYAVFIPPGPPGEAGAAGVTGAAGGAAGGGQ